MPNFLACTFIRGWCEAPLFSAMDPAPLGKLAELANTRIFLPGDTVIEQALDHARIDSVEAMA